jgi:hypothetical protein
MAVIDNEANPAFNEDEELNNILQLLGPWAYEKAVLRRGLSFIHGALLIVKNSEIGNETEKAALEKKLKDIEEQWKAWSKNNKYDHDSILALQKILKKVLISNIPEFKSKSGSKYFKKTKALMHAESFENLKSREEVVSEIQYGDLYQRRIDTPITAFTVSQTSEWMAIIGEEKYKPKWFTKLAKWEQKYLREKVEGWVKKGKKGNLGDYIGVFPTTVRAYPGARNSYTSTLITYRKDGEQEHEISRTMKVRSGHVAPMEMGDKVARLEATKENIKQLILANVKAQLENGNADILICLQTLISPVGVTIGGKKLGVEDYKMNLVRMEAVKWLQKNLCNEKGFREFLLSNNVALEGGHRPTLTLLSSNHAVNMGRFFTRKNKENQETLGKLSERAKMIPTNAKALAALERIKEINGKGDRISKLKNFLKFGMNHNAERAALEQIAVDALGGVRIGGCKSAKDREGGVSMHWAAMLLYYDKYQTFPPVPRRGKSFSAEDIKKREEYEDLVADQFLGGHDINVANENAEGSLGIKDVKVFLGRNVMKRAAEKIKEKMVKVAAAGFKNDMTFDVIGERSDEAASLNKLSRRGWYNPKKIVESIRVSIIARKLRKIQVPKEIQPEISSEAVLEEEKVHADHVRVAGNVPSVTLATAPTKTVDIKFYEEPEPEEIPPQLPSSYDFLEEGVSPIPLRGKNDKYKKGDLIGPLLIIQDITNASEPRLKGYVRDADYQEAVVNIIIEKVKESVKYLDALMTEMQKPYVEDPIVNWLLEGKRDKDRYELQDSFSLFQQGSKPLPEPLKELCKEIEKIHGKTIVEELNKLSENELKKVEVSQKVKVGKKFNLGKKKRIVADMQDKVTLRSAIKGHQPVTKAAGSVSSAKSVRFQSVEEPKSLEALSAPSSGSGLSWKVFLDFNILDSTKNGKAYINEYAKSAKNSNIPKIPERNKDEFYAVGAVVGPLLIVNDHVTANKDPIVVGYVRNKLYQEVVADIIYEKLKNYTWGFDPSDDDEYNTLVRLVTIIRGSEDDPFKNDTLSGKEERRLFLFKTLQKAEKEFGSEIVKELDKWQLAHGQQLKKITFPQKYTKIKKPVSPAKPPENLQAASTSSSATPSAFVVPITSQSEDKASQMISGLKKSFKEKYIVKFGNSSVQYINKEKQIQIKNILTRMSKLELSSDITPIAWLEIQTRILLAIQANMLVQFEKRPDFLNEQMQKNDPVFKTIAEMLKTIRKERVSFLGNNNEEANGLAGSKTYDALAKKYLADDFMMQWGSIKDKAEKKEVIRLKYESTVLKNALAITTPFPGFVEFMAPPTSGKQEKAEFTGFYIDENGKKWMIKMSKEHQPDNFAEVVTSSLLGSTISDDHSVPYKFIKSRNGDLYIMSEVRNEFQELSKVLKNNDVDISLASRWVGSNPVTDDNKEKIHQVIMAQGPEFKKQMATILAGCILVNDVDCQVGNLSFYTDKDGVKKMAKFDDGWGLADIALEKHSYVKLFERVKFSDGIGILASKGAHKGKPLPTNHFLDYPHILYSTEFVMALDEVSKKMLESPETFVQKAFKNIDDTFTGPIDQEGKAIESPAIKERNQKELKEGYVLLAKHLSVQLTESESDFKANADDVMKVRQKIEKELTKQLTNRAKSMRLLSISINMKLIVDKMSDMDKESEDYPKSKAELQRNLIQLFVVHRELYPKEDVERKNIIPRLQDAPFPFQKTNRRDFLKKVLDSSEIDIDDVDMRKFYDQLRAKKKPKKEIKEDIVRAPSAPSISDSNAAVPATGASVVHTQSIPKFTPLSALRDRSPAPAVSTKSSPPPLLPSGTRGQHQISTTIAGIQPVDISDADLKTANEKMIGVAELTILPDRRPQLSGQPPGNDPMEGLQICVKSDNLKIRALGSLPYTLMTDPRVPWVWAIKQAKQCLEHPTGKQITSLKIGKIGATGVAEYEEYSGAKLIEFKQKNGIKYDDAIFQRPIV